MANEFALANDNIVIILDLLFLIFFPQKLRFKSIILEMRLRWQALKSQSKS
jgi:hypothetical protein